MFSPPKKCCQQVDQKGRRKAMRQEEIHALKQTITSTPKANRPFVLDQPAAPVEEVQKMIVRTASNTFERQEYLTPLASAKLWDINFVEWTNKMNQAKQYCIIYNAKLTAKEMENICLLTFKYICFMLTLPDYTDYKLEESEMMLRKLDSPFYDITKAIPWIAQKWPEIQQYLQTANIYLMGEAPLTGLSSRDVSFESESVQKEESDEEEYDISADRQEEEEEDIFNPRGISEKAKSTEDKGKGRLMTE